MESHMGTESVLHTVFNLIKAFLRYLFSEREKGIEREREKKDKERGKKINLYHYKRLRVFGDFISS